MPEFLFTKALRSHYQFVNIESFLALKCNVYFAYLFNLYYNFPIAPVFLIPNASKMQQFAQISDNLSTTQNAVNVRRSRWHLQAVCDLFG
jgi:hypothetical protein